MKDKMSLIFKIIIFFLSLFLVIYGQRTVGKGYLFMQLLGLSGLLVLLWNYNRKFV